jgi:hypothetical protein
VWSLIRYDSLSDSLVTNVNLCFPLVCMFATTNFQTKWDSFAPWCNQEFHRLQRNLHAVNSNLSL